jgi:hypothetical protein
MSSRTTGRTKRPMENPLKTEKTARATMQQVATVAAAELCFEQRTCRAQSATPATNTTPRSSSTTHHPLTANSV